VHYCPVYGKYLASALFLVASSTIRITHSLQPQSWRRQCDTVKGAAKLEDLEYVQNRSKIDSKNSVPPFFLYKVDYLEHKVYF
jgi:hypothetical protein